MSSFNNIKQEIQYNIADNDSQAITASILRGTLIDMIDATDMNILQSDWDETNPLSNAYIKNKPAAPAGQQQADWNVNDDTSVAYIKHKPTIPTMTSQLINDSNFVADPNYVHTSNNFTNADKSKLDGIEQGAEKNVQADWAEPNPLSDSYINNKPSIPSGQQQADWAEDDPSDVTYIKNKPDIPALQVQADWNVTDTESAAYIKNKPAIPTLTSQLTNDSNFAYISDIPTKTSQLTNDSNFVQDANYVHTDNNFTNTYLNKLEGIQSGAEANVQSNWNEADTSSDAYILNKPFIPTKTSDLINDSGFGDVSAVQAQLDTVERVTSYALNYLNTYSVQDPNYVHTDNNFTDAYKELVENAVTEADLASASYVSSTYINNIVRMTMTEYYNLQNPDAYTLYLCN